MLVYFAIVTQLVDRSTLTALHETIGLKLFATQFESNLSTSLYCKVKLVLCAETATLIEKGLDFAVTEVILAQFVPVS